MKYPHVICKSPITYLANMNEWEMMATVDVFEKIIVSGYASQI